MKQPIETKDAPAAIGPYSQAIKVQQTVYCSGQIALDSQTMQLVNSSLEAEAEQVFKNLSCVVRAAGASMNEVVKITIYLVEMADFDVVNKVMMTFFSAPYPARATVAVSALPRQARVEVDAVVVLND